MNQVPEVAVKQGIQQRQRQRIAEVMVLCDRYVRMGRFLGKMLDLVPDELAGQMRVTIDGFIMTTSSMEHHMAALADDMMVEHQDMILKLGYRRRQAAAISSSRVRP